MYSHFLCLVSDVKLQYYSSLIFLSNLERKVCTFLKISGNVGKLNPRRVLTPRFQGIKSRTELTCKDETVSRIEKECAQVFKISEIRTIIVKLKYIEIEVMRGISLFNFRKNQSD